jgi:hypothetical protein
MLHVNADVFPTVLIRVIHPADRPGSERQAATLHRRADGKSDQRPSSPPFAVQYLSFTGLRLLGLSTGRTQCFNSARRIFVHFALTGPDVT